MIRGSTAAGWLDMKDRPFTRHWVFLPTGASALLALAAAVLAGEPLPSGLTREALEAANTAEQHQAIADAYTQEASEAHAAASAHRSMANPPGQYMSTQRPGASDRRVNTGPAYLTYHCRALAESLEKAAREADALAVAHHMMAERARRPTAK